MTHPLVLQLRFTRSEFQRGLQQISDQEAIQRFEPINSISWVIGHMANQEQRYWLTAAQGITLVPGLNDLVGFGKPASTPPLAEMWQAWHTITEGTNAWLDSLTTEQLTTHMVAGGDPLPESIGSMMRRMTYHYWFHLGEAQAIRQLLGHTQLPVFVGDIHYEAPYIPEN